MPISQITSASIAANTITSDDMSSTAQYYGFKNRLINGAMGIDQRYAGAATANTINGYTVDRWAVLQSTTGKLIAQQNQGSVTPPAGFTNYLGVTSQSAYSVLAGDIYRFVQQIEGLNVADLGWGTANAQTVTLSFWVRSSLTGTFGGAIGNNTGASTYPFTYTISSANTWEQKTLTIPGPTFGTYATNNTTSIYLQFALGLGSSTAGGTANTWGTSAVGGPTGTVSVVGTNGATWYITGVQLEKGSTATSFDYRPYGTELQLCQRYYQTIPSFIVDCHYGSTGSGVATYTPYQSIPLTGQMRTTPTMATSSFNIVAGPTTATASIASTSSASFQTYVNKGANAWATGSNTFTYTITATAEL